MRQKSVCIKISWSEYLFEKWLETDAKVNLRKSNTSKEKNLYRLNIGMGLIDLWSKAGCYDN